MFDPTEKTLTETFNEARQALPALLAHTTPSGMGRYGLAVDTGKGTLIKVLYRYYDDPSMQQHSERLHRNELYVLRALKNADLHGFMVPALLDETETDLSHDRFYTSFEMTKIPGAPLDWESFMKSADAGEQERYFRQAGELMAHFHAALSACPANPDTLSPFETVKVAVANGDRKLNKALRAADRYFQAGLEHSGIHGDFHGDNILGDDQNRITGLIDFATVRSTKNRLKDFKFIPDAVIPHALHGYGDAAGKPVDPDMITLTKLDSITGWINYLQTQPEKADELEKTQMEMNACLHNIRHITGFTPR